jgi:hypothetical protein
MGPTGAEHLMLVEFNFNRKKLKVKAGEIQETVRKELKKRGFPLSFKIESVTVMGKWLIILVDFPNLTDHNKEVDFLWDALAGVVVLNFDVRYRHFTVHGQGPSLIFK